jgi:hypothetical protein
MRSAQHLPATLLEALRAVVLVGVVLVGTVVVNVLLIVHLLRVLLSLALGLLAVEPVLALGLSELFMSVQVPDG